MTSINEAIRYLDVFEKNWDKKAQSSINIARDKWGVVEAVVRMDYMQKYNKTPETPADLIDVLEWCIVAVQYKEIRNEIPENAIFDLTRGIYHKDELFNEVENGQMCMTTAKAILNRMYGLIKAMIEEPINMTVELAQEIEKAVA